MFLSFILPHALGIIPRISSVFVFSVSLMLQSATSDGQLRFMTSGQNKEPHHMEFWTMYIHSSVKLNKKM